MRPSASSAIFAGILAFGLWGVLPVYWKQLGQLGSDLAIAHRVLWTMITVVPMLLIQREWGLWVDALRDRQTWLVHAWSGLLLTINWAAFVWAAHHGHIIDASLGYFINPLLNVLIGSVILGERLSVLQRWSIASAAFGVALQIVAAGRFPWIGLTLALSMAFYALARRRSHLGSLTGLATETLVFVPLALAYLWYAAQQGRPLWGAGGAWNSGLVLGLGIITAIPLLGFGHAARQLPFALLGVLQFLAPTGQFLVGALVYGELVSRQSLLSFVFIWTGVALFCTDLWRRSRRPAAISLGP